jgi:archaeal flagellar protein FlaJ
MRIPLIIIPSEKIRIFNNLFSNLSLKISKILPGLKYDLEEAEIKISEQNYITLALVNSVFYFILFFSLFYVLFLTQGKSIQLVTFQSLGYSILIFLLFLYTIIKYPSILAGKKAERIDKHLIFALKDLLLQITSGVTLHNGLVNVSKAGYGQASLEFKKVVQEVNAGMPMDRALEKMAVESRSDFLKRTTWQLINSIKAGSSLKGTLRNLIDDLNDDQKDKIKRYSAELNLWGLLYMLFAVAVPTIGATMLIILSSFAGYGITKEIFIFFIVICFIIQIVLIGFVKTRRPIANI